ncbi:MAG TPA: TRAP transporter substrate-binding protein [Dehalococcoidia bacterium]|nr:TRAP transporter substrate-binding protein [Dehalococcoidia bacterium]
MRQKCLLLVLSLVLVGSLLAVACVRETTVTKTQVETRTVTEAAAEITVTETVTAAPVTVTETVKETVTVTATAPPQPVIMRVTSDAPAAPHPKGAAMDWFKAELEKRIPGSEVRLYPAGSLYTDPDAVEALALGTLEACWGQAGKISGFEPKASIFALPFLLTSKEAVLALPDSELGRYISDLMETKGIKTLGYGYVSTYLGMCSTYRITTPDDLKGKKFRVFVKLTQEPMMEALGCSPTTLAWAEVPSALGSGVVDGVCTSTGGWRKIKDLAPYYTTLGYGGFGTDLYPFWVSTKWWNTLTPETQAVIAQTAYEACLYEQELQDKDDQRMLDEYGTTDPTKPGIYVLSKEEAEAFRALWVPAVYDKLAAVVGKDLVAMAVAFAEQFK